MSKSANDLGLFVPVDRAWRVISRTRLPAGRVNRLRIRLGVALITGENRSMQQTVAYVDSEPGEIVFEIKTYHGGCRGRSQG